MDEKCKNFSSSTLQIPCVILSGGRSSRMGTDKSLLKFKDSNTLIEYQYNRLKPFFKEVYISSKDDKFSFSCKKIYDKDDSCYSPLLALKSILEEIEDEKIFIITVDTPFVKIDSICNLVVNSLEYDIVVAKTKERVHNLCGVFDRRVLETIDLLLKDDIHKVGALLKEVKTNYTLFEDEDEFLNLNTINEYNKAIKLL